MVIHICSWFGDIEIMALPNDRARVRWLKLIPHEKKALKQFFKAQGLKVKLDAEGTTEVDLSAVGVCTLLSPLLHSGKQAITAIKFSTGEVEVTDKPVAAVIKDDAAGVDAVVQVQKPARGCPMPSATEMKEVRAAYVVRKFLAAGQLRDFDARRAFVAVGCDTGHTYRITSRWSPDVEQYGALYDVARQAAICASNLDVPPSEESLSLKFSVEHFEQRFLDS